MEEPRFDSGSFYNLVSSPTSDHKNASYALLVVVILSKTCSKWIRVMHLAPVNTWMRVHNIIYVLFLDFDGFSKTLLREGVICWAHRC